MAAHRLARRANVLVLLDDGLSCEAIAKVLFLDDDPIRALRLLYREDGIEEPAKPAAFINAYEDLVNQLSADAAAIFADAAHPTHAVRPVGCRAPKEAPVAVEQSSGGTASTFMAPSLSRPAKPS